MADSCVGLILLYKSERERVSERERGGGERGRAREREREGEREGERESERERAM